MISLRFALEVLSHDPKEAVAELAREALIRHRLHAREFATASPTSFSDPLPISQQRRVLDAAVPEQVPIGRSTQLITLIRLASSEGLRGLLTTVAYLVGPDDVAGSPAFALEFTRDAQGHAQAASIILEVEAPDFLPPQQRQTVAVPPDGDSSLYIFQLTPRITGVLFLTLRVLVGDVCVATRPLRTNGQQVEDESLLRSEAASYTLVSLPLTVNVIRATSVQMQSGGINLHSEGDLRVSGDVTGRNHVQIDTTFHDSPLEPEPEAEASIASDTEERALVVVKSDVRPSMSMVRPISWLFMPWLLLGILLGLVVAGVGPVLLARIQDLFRFHP